MKKTLIILASFLKSSFVSFVFPLLFLLTVSCTKESGDKTSHSTDKNSEQHDLNSQKSDSEPDTPLQEGTIRGYFGNTYRSFVEHIEKEHIRTFTDSRYLLLITQMMFLQERLVGILYLL